MTGIMAAIIGNAPAFNPASGLFRRRYSGYFFDDVDYFNGAALTESTVDTGVLAATGTTNYSQEWIGYFKPDTTEDYRFQINSSDAAYLWIDTYAKNGYETYNATINNGGTHEILTVTSSYLSLTANVYYPIRIQFGNYINIGGQGQNFLTVAFERSNTNPGTWVQNFTGLSFYNFTTKGF